MSILGMQLETHDLSRTRAFYVDKLGLSVDHTEQNGFGVRIGETRLRFVQAENGSQPAYYYQVGVPQAHYANAIQWVERRGIQANHSSGNVNTAYTHDPVGNVLHFVALNRSASATTTPLLNICGIGLAVNDVQQPLAYLQEYLAATADPVPTLQHTILQRDAVRFVFTATGKVWPAGGQQARAFPIIMSLKDTINGTAKLLDYPYYVYRIAFPITGHVSEEWR